MAQSEKIDTQFHCTGMLYIWKSKKQKKLKNYNGIKATFLYSRNDLHCGIAWDEEFITV